MRFSPGDYNPRDVGRTASHLMTEHDMTMDDAVSLFNRYAGASMFEVPEADRADLAVARRYLLGIVGRHESRRAGGPLLPKQEAVRAS